VGETVARTVIGTQAPTKSRVFTGTHNSRWIAGPPHIGLGFAMGHNIDPATLTRGEGEGGLHRFVGDSAATYSIGNSLALVLRTAARLQ
jgi:hypothetical protein